MMMLWNLFDGVLALLVMVLGWLVVSSQDMKRAVVLFIAFGLLMSLIWARLAAPDLALADLQVGDLPPREVVALPAAGGGEQGAYTEGQSWEPAWPLGRGLTPGTDGRADLPPQAGTDPNLKRWYPVAEGTMLILEIP